MQAREKRSQPLDWTPEAGFSLDAMMSFNSATNPIAAVRYPASKPFNDGLRASMRRCHLSRSAIQSLISPSVNGIAAPALAIRRELAGRTAPALDMHGGACAAGDAKRGGAGVSTGGQSLARAFPTTILGGDNGGGSSDGAHLPRAPRIDRAGPRLTAERRQGAAPSWSAAQLLAGSAGRIAPERRGEIRIR